MGGVRGVIEDDEDEALPQRSVFVSLMSESDMSSPQFASEIICAVYLDRLQHKEEGAAEALLGVHRNWIGLDHLLLRRLLQHK